jgi:hypothetical protein
MATLVKTFSGQPVRVNFEDGLERQAEALLAALEGQHAQGMTVRAGAHIRFGWSFLIFQEGIGELVVCEPDYTSNPFAETRDDVSVFLRVLASQTALVQMLGVTPIEVSFQDKIIYANGVFESGQIYAERIQPRPEKRDSGWFVGFTNGDNSQANLRSGYVFQLLTHKPILMQTLLLPPGCIVLLDGNQIRDVVDSDDRSLLRR